ncbi:hypothetical protein LCGC14_0851980 [marine sediment metagenome]|uniref:Uncharacterized protein n=1 Tax=marine sediment metagenome TaxID=412755 RepID=A0A0F9RUT0_9ZZZZ
MKLKTLKDLKFKGIVIDYGTEKELKEKRKMLLKNKSFTLLKPHPKTGEPYISWMGTKKKFMTFPQFKPEDFNITEEDLK